MAGFSLISILLAICLTLIAFRPAATADPNVSPRRPQVLDLLQSVTPAAKARLRRLARLARQRWAIPGESLKIEGDPRRGLLKKVYGVLSGPSKEGPERIARQFLQKNADLFLLKKGHLSDLEAYWQRESPGGVHLRFKQLHRGLTVHGASLSVHLDRKGRVRQVSNRYLPEIPDLGELSPQGPTLTREEALSLARRHLRIQGGLRGKPWAGLLLYPQEAKAHLAWQVALPARRPLGDWLVTLDAGTGEVLEVKDLLRRFSGKGWVFDPNPVVTLGPEKGSSLTDQDDRREAVPGEAYVQVTLEELDGSGYLKGLYVDTGETPRRTRKPGLNFDCRRDEGCFEEVMAYYHIDRYQRYLQGLGFTGEKAILAEPQRVDARDPADEDNSFFSPLEKVIHYGTGGVDDAEDADIILHEYGHALQEEQVPGFAGGDGEAGAIGEGFSDYLAASFFASAGFDEACIGDWDARGFSPPTSCLRRVDGDKHYPEDLSFEIHADGEIWSAALWELRRILGQEVADRLAIQVNFYLEPDDGFRAAAEAVLQADRDLSQGANQEAIRDVLVERGLLLPPDALEENDSLEEAAPIELPFDHHQLSLDSPGDEDFYHFFLDQAASVEIRLAFQSDAGDLDLFLLDAEGKILRSSTTSEDVERIIAYSLSPGLYRIQVKGKSPGAINPYSLQVIPSGLLLPDGFEENDSLEGARPIQLPFEGRELTLDSPEDRDFYRFSLDQAGPLMVRLDFSPPSGDLDLSLLDGAGSPVGRSESSPNGKRLFLQGLAPGIYAIQVASPSGAANRYDLAAFVPLLPPMPDRFEENDSLDRAAPIELPFVTHDLNLDAANDADYYEFSLDQTRTVEIDLAFSHVAGDLDLWLLSSRGAILGRSSSLDDNERLRVPNLPPGTYVVKVFGFLGATNAYSLRIASAPPLPPDPLEENDSPDQATPIELPFDRHDLTIDSPEDEDFYRFVLDRPATVAALLLSPSVEGDLDLYLLDSREKVLKSSVRERDLERITASLPAGQYFLKVAGFRGDLDPYELTLYRVESDGTDAPPPDLRLSADRLEFGEVRVGDHADLSLTLTNGGAGDLRVSQLKADSAHFSILSPRAPLRLGPEESREIVVRFSPLSVGTQSGTLTLISDDPDQGVAAVALSGTGKTLSAIVVNEGEEYTRNRRVALRLFPLPDAVRMRFSNDGTRWSRWMKVSTTATWNLSPADGLKTVEVQFQNGGGMPSGAASDTIRLDTRPPQGEIRIHRGDSSVPEGVPVTLTLQAGDGGSGLSQMMIANSSRFRGGIWEEYSPEKSWSLEPGKGMRTVFVRYRDRAGNVSRTFKDSIRVTGNP
ncbi:MAG: choice-of-anchor D domain-containing protein [Nitrospinae bacterium]|nr:choice-of-anchor D domain-containing protein [Nitrospinota bacterium]